MITPAYAPTATERVLPRLALDFTTGVLDSRVTVTRALNTATRVNSSGYIEVVNANLPRFDYDPLTLAPKGLLIEETRSNICLNSQNLAGGFWTGSDATIGPDQILSPDGTVNAYKIFETATVAQHRLAQAVTTVNATVYTVSMYLKKGSRDIIRVVLNEPNKLFVADLTNGTITSFTTTTATIQNVGNGWFRCTASFTSVGTTTTISSYPIVGGSSSYLGVVTEGWYQYGVQLEAGAFATSYIPTTTTSLTRNNDIVVLTGANFTSWYSAGAGTLYSEASQPVIFAVSRTSASLCASANNPRLSIYRQAAGNLQGFVINSAGTANAVGSGVAAVANTTNKTVLAYSATDIQTISANASVAGSIGGIDMSSSFASFTTLAIGAEFNGSPNAWCGHVRKVMWWPQKLTDAEVRAFSK